PFLYLNFVFAAAVGYATGEVVSRSANRKRGRGLAVIAGLSVALSYLVSILLFGGFVLFSIQVLVLDLLALALGIFIAVSRLR
ncbi:hypothetical protein ACFLUE_02675, partial [Chloroflexota bacterium]